ncbi:HPr family phosphocarrier protein [Mucilaginibacter sp.]
MITKEYIITASQGLHARPATTLIRLTKNFKSSISLKKADKTIKLNSMLNLLSLGIKGGDKVSVIIDGEDEISVVIALDEFFKDQLKDL